MQGGGLLIYSLTLLLIPTIKSNTYIPATFLILLANFKTTSTIIC